MNKYEIILRYIFSIGFYVVALSQMGRFDLTIVEQQGIMFLITVGLYQILKLNKK